MLISNINPFFLEWFRFETGRLHEYNIPEETSIWRKYTMEITASDEHEKASTVIFYTLRYENIFA